MNRFLLFAAGLALVLAFQNCATAIPLSPRETCALDDLKLHNTDQGGAIVAGYGSGGSALAVGKSKVIRCELPATDVEKLEVTRTRTIVAPKAEYNSSIGTKKLITGIGWLAGVPGIIAKFYYDHEYDKAVRESERIAATLSEKSAENSP